MENETNVAAAPSSPEPDKTAAKEQVDELAGGAPGAAIAEAKETPVSTPVYPDHQIESERDRAGLSPQAQNEMQNPVALAKEYTDSAIENAKADILKHLTELVKPIVASSAAAAAAIEPSPVTAHELAVGDPVQVWVDKKANIFRLGKIAGIHDGAHAFDVELDDGTVTKINADGVQFDDRR